MPNFLSGATDLVTTLLNHAEDVFHSMPGSFLSSAENKTGPLRGPVDNLSRRRASNSSPARSAAVPNAPLDKFLEGTFGSEINISDDDTPQPLSKNTRSQVRTSRAHGTESDEHDNMSWANRPKKPFLISSEGTQAPALKGRSALQYPSSRQVQDGEPPHKKLRLETDRPGLNPSKPPMKSSSRLSPRKDSVQRSSSKQDRLLKLDHQPSSSSTSRDRKQASPPMRTLSRSSLTASDDSRQMRTTRQREINGATSSTAFNDSPHPHSGHRNSRRRTLSSNINSSYDTPPSKITRRYDGSPDVLQGASTVLEDTKRSRPSKELAPPARDPSSSWDYTFELNSFICEPDPQEKGWHLSMSMARRKLDFHLQGPDQVNYVLLFRSITNIHIPDDEDSNIIRLGVSSCPLGTKLYLEFCSLQERTNFLLTVLDTSSSITPQSKSSQWLRRALCVQRMANEEGRVRKSHQNTSTPRSETDFVDHAPRQTPALISSVRQRNIDTLDKPQREPIPEQKATTKTKTQDKHNDASPISKSSGLLRQTRSSTTHVDSTPKSEIPISTPRRRGLQWGKSLVYPPNGKRKETVTWDDLAGLEDDAFLNDSLIGLFLRYLQEHCEQENLSKMHFFNSFFFEALTRNVDKKKNQVINYSSVASWTKKINLFTRDFVVVPVNENLHWYVMIICNLRGLAKQKSALSDAEIDGETFDDAEVGALEQDEKVILQSDVVDTDSFEADVRTSSQNTPVKYGKRKKIRTRRKYEVDKPIIITLDSFEIPRGPTVSALKHYLIEEAKKHDLELDKEDFQGMTAKGIPTQSNFSDCGLYMCLYMEQFMRDPYAFVKCILQRETNSLQWPKKIESSDLRDRYYAMLQEMYLAQKEKRTAEIREVGQILIDMLDKEVETETGQKTKSAHRVQALSPESVRAGIEGYNEYRANVENGLLEEVDGPEGNSSANIKAAPQSRQDHNGSILETVTIEDHSREERNGDKSSPYFATGAAKTRPVPAKSASPITSSYFQTNQRDNERYTPLGHPPYSVQRTRQSSSSARRRASQHSIIDLSSPAEQHSYAHQANPDRPSSSKRARAERPRSELLDDEALALPVIEKFLRSRDDVQHSMTAPNGANYAERDSEEPFEGFDDLPGAQLNSALAADVATNLHPNGASRPDQKVLERERDYIPIDADESPHQQSFVPETPDGDGEDQHGDSDMLLD